MPPPAAEMNSFSITGTSIMKKAPYAEPAMLPRPPTMIIARYRMDTSSVNDSQVTVSV